MPNNKNRNTITTAAVNKKDLVRANKYLGSAGYRICAYTGKLLTLNSKNFNKMSSDQFGFQPISRDGQAAYNQFALQATVETQPYNRNQGSTTELV